MAEKASVERNSFRAIFFLPLQAKRLKQRLSHPNATLVMKFPDDSVSFIPDNYWHGGNRKAGCYKEANTNMVLIMYESENKRDLQPINYNKLQQKLAAWYINKTPNRNHEKEKLQFTGIDMKHYERILRAKYPEEWKFWKPTTHEEETSQIQQYHGSCHDTRHLGKTPFKDIVQWNRMAAHIGHLPDTFAIFLKEMGVQTKQIKNTTQDIVKMMKTHTLIMFKTYWKSTTERVQSSECGDTDTEEDLQEDNNNKEQEGSEAIIVPTTNDWYKWLAQKETDHFTSDDDTDKISHSTQNDDLDDNDHHTNSASPSPPTGGRGPPPAPRGGGVSRYHRDKP